MGKQAKAKAKTKRAAPSVEASSVEASSVEANQLPAVNAVLPALTMRHRSSASMSSPDTASERIWTSAVVVSPSPAS